MSLIESNPELAKEWHPTKNGDLSPKDVTPGSGKKVWWLCPYDDPKTGKHFDFEWEAYISHRARGIGCPYLSGKAVWPGFNDLATTNPELVKEWNQTRNGSLSPKDVSAGSSQKVWWIYPYDDPKTGKHFDFEWEAVICTRTKGVGCPFIPPATNPSVWPGFNDLETINPELAKEWHPTKNGDLSPRDVTPGSGKKVWWLFPYDDPKTGKHFDFEWEAMISDRVRGRGCPFIPPATNPSVWPGFNDLETINPELAKEWHPTKNGDLSPRDVTPGSGKKVWWLFPYDDPKTGKHFDFEWNAVIKNRTGGLGCPYLSGKAVWPGFNDLATTNPELVKEWNQTRNGSLSPKDVSAGSSQKVWWIYPYDDPKTGKHFDFEWQAAIADRVKGKGCPFISGKAVWPGFNDLATTNPELVKEWNQTRNGSLSPKDVSAGSSQKVWWIYPYDDPKTGKHFDFEWEAVICTRTKGVGCPFIPPATNPSVWPGFNDLETINPELAKEWHPTKNGNLRPNQVNEYSNKRVWWFIPYDDPNTGKHFDFEWQAYISHRAKGIGCPYLSGKAAWPGYNDLTTTNPELAAEWHPTKNGKLRPEYARAGSDKKVWWLIKYENPKNGKIYDLEWEASIEHRVAGQGCPFLFVSKGESLLAEILPATFEREKTLKNSLKRFDFFDSEGKMAIEYDGLQHFKATEFFGGEKALVRLNKSDSEKNQYCKSNNIALLRIPYIFDPITDREEIENIVLNFLKTKKIPAKIKKFYLSIETSNYCDCLL